ncbi:MAG: hypothetical protein Q9186_005523 [Xanthomendoza sp. 1 TL-2023]
MDMSMSPSSTMGNMAMDTTASGMNTMPTATSAMGASPGMGGMGMGMGSSACKISMLWNWNTVDSCFISSSWHITSPGKFAGSCIGVVALVCVLELIRRLSRDYDRYILKGQTRSVFAPLTSRLNKRSEDKEHTHSRATEREAGGSLSSNGNDNTEGHEQPRQLRRRGPTILQQMVRAVLHTTHFGLAYFIMLLAMYYNGYIIICIFLGALIGSFAFSSDMTAEYEGSGCCG